MDGPHFDTLVKAFGSGGSRRRVLRGVLAIAGGSALVHHTGGASIAGKRRCCRKLKRGLAKDNCIGKGGENCKVVNFTCEKDPAGGCNGSWACRDDTTSNPDCI